MKHIIQNLDIKESFTEKDGNDLAELLNSVKKPNMVAVEIGSWKGFSSYYLASALKKYGDLYCVDTWQGSTEEHKKEIEKKDIYKLFQNNMIALDVWPVISPIRKDSILASNTFENKSVDFVFIDGDHRYQPFMNDVMSWIIKVKPGGIICGHDCENKYTAFPYRLKRKFGNSTDKDFILGRWHPGIIKGLYDLFQDDYELQGKIWYKKING